MVLKLGFRKDRTELLGEHLLADEAKTKEDDMFVFNLKTTFFIDFQFAFIGEHSHKEK